MPDNPKSGRKDHHLVTDTTDELKETVRQDRLVPKYANPNRDRVRGDRDRSRKHTNEA